MTESEEKAAFAQAMISANMNPLEAGQLVHPANFNRAAQIASMWHNDAEVKAMIAEIKKAEHAETGISEDEKYVEEKLKEIEENDDDTPVYKYEPKDIATVIYEKVATIMEQKKGELYKKFKSKYNRPL